MPTQRHKKSYTMKPFKRKKAGAQAKFNYSRKHRFGTPGMNAYMTAMAGAMALSTESSMRTGILESMGFHVKK